MTPKPIAEEKKKCTVFMLHKKDGIVTILGEGAPFLTMSFHRSTRLRLFRWQDLYSVETPCLQICKVLYIRVSAWRVCGVQRVSLYPTSA